VDLLLLQHLAAELDERLRGSRIEQVYALPKKDVVLVAGRRSGPRLWFSAEPDQPHLYLRDGSHPTPKRPPGFAMAARNLLGGRRIAAVTWVSGDRIVELICAGQDAPRLVFELIPRRSTALVIDADNVVRAVWQPRRGRPTLGDTYVPPRADPRAPAEKVDRETWDDLRAAPDDDTLVRGLLRSIAGMSPLLAREIVWRHGAGTPLEDAARQEQQRAAEAATAACIYSPLPLDALASRPPTRDFLLSPFPLRHLEARADDDALRVATFETLSDAAAAFYPLRAGLAALDAARGALRAALDIGIARVQRTLDAVSDDAAGAGNAEEHRQWADLLLAYPRAERRGAVVRLPNPYADDGDAMVVVEIPINPATSLVDNAQAYYARARRAERSAERTAARSRALRTRLGALQGLLGGLGDVAEVGDCVRLARTARSHGVRVGTDKWAPPEAARSARAVETDEEPRSAGQTGGPDHPRGAAPPAAGIAVYTSSDGFEILVGRNAKANERLTHKLAAPHDFWLHAEGPGSHVVIRNPERTEQPSADALREAASLAAYFSFARGATKVNVRWTQARRVKKPRGGPTGQVVLRQAKTVLAEPMPPEQLFATPNED
jgi:predicted ribosome quality control (RQC) complex YloA/Tae2 family protein